MSLRSHRGGLAPPKYDVAHDISAWRPSLVRRAHQAETFNRQVVNPFIESRQFGLTINHRSSPRTSMLLDATWIVAICAGLVGALTVAAISTRYTAQRLGARLERRVLRHRGRRFHLCALRLARPRLRSLASLGAPARGADLARRDGRAKLVRVLCRPTGRGAVGAAGDRHIRGGPCLRARRGSDRPAFLVLSGHLGGERQPSRSCYVSHPCCARSRSTAVSSGAYLSAWPRSCCPCPAFSCSSRSI